VVGLEWYPCCRVKPATRIPLQPIKTYCVSRTLLRMRLAMDVCRVLSCVDSH